MNPIKTSRLELRPLSDADRDRVVDILRDETVKRTYMVPDITSQEKEENVFWH